MAEAKRLIEYVDAETLDGVTDEFSDERAAYEELRNSMTADAMGIVRVSKIPTSKLTGHPTHTKSAHCFAVPMDRYSFDELVEFVRENYGGGLYRMLGVQPGKKGNVFNKLVEIVDTKAKPDSPTPQQNPSSVFDSVANLIAQSQQRTEELMMRLTSAVKPGADPADAMTKTMAMFTAMISAMAPIFGAAKVAPVGGGFMEEMQKFAALKTLLESMGGGGDSDKESNLYDVASTAMRTFAPLIANAIPGANGAVAAPPPQNLQLAGPSPSLSNAAGGPSSTAPPGFASPQAPPSVVTPAALSPGDTHIKNQVDLLVGQARGGANPRNLAETIFRITPDGDLEKLDAFIRDPLMLPKMTALNPEVLKYQDFFGALKLALIEILDESLAPDASSARDPVQPSP